MSILDLVFPRRCLNCGRAGKYFCDQCQSGIRLIATNESICPVCEKLAIDGATHPRCRTRYSLDGLTSFFRYDGVIRKAVKALKYRLVSDLASEFVSLIPSSLFVITKPCTLSPKPYVLVPIPLHRSRLMERGFNQAEILGSLLADRLSAQAGLHVPMRTDILRRVKKTTPQVAMRDRKERLGNMKNVFAIHDSLFTIHASYILLFDDVFTTGATIRAAANVLKGSGIKYVWAVTMAR